MAAPIRRNRILAVDMLRGVCLVEMMLNHLPCNLLTSAAGQTFGFVSAAEGFVFLSGFVAGRTATGALAGNKPLKYITRRMLLRAAQLYAFYVALLTIVLAAIKIEPSRFAEWGRLCRLGTASVEQLWLSGVVFLHLPHFLDIFPIYCVFLPLVPLLISQIRAGRLWLVLTFSVGVWTISQLWHLSNPPDILDNFNLLAWQLLFTVGVALGYRSNTAEDQPNPERWRLVLCGIFCIALFALRQAPRLGVFVPTLSVFDKSTLGIVRLLNFAALAYILRAALRWLGPGIQEHWLYQKLAFLGQHSLQVFAWSVGATYVAYLYGEWWQSRWPLPVLIQVCLAGTAIVMLWVPAFLHAAWKNSRLPSPAVDARAKAIVPV